MSRWATVLLVALAVGAGVFVFVIEPGMTSSRDRDLSRDRVLGVDATMVTEIEIVTGDDVVQLERKPNGWWVGPRPRDRASDAAVLAILGRLTNLEVLDRIGADEFESGAAKLDDYGLETSKSEIRLSTLDGQEVTLLLGREAVGSGRVYVRRGDSKEVFVVSDELVELAFQRAKKFRDPVLTALGVGQIDRFTLRTAAGELEVARSLAGWEIVRPLRARASGEAVEKFLQPILQAQIEDFVADESDDLSAFGLGEPRAELIFYANGEKRPLALRFGAEVAGGESVVVQSTARDSVYHLPVTVWEQLRVTPADLRDRRLMNLNLDTIDRIRITREGAVRELERTETGWRLGEEELAEGDVAQRVAALTAAGVTAYLPASAVELAAHGFDDPAGEVEFDAWLSENTPEARKGRLAVHQIVIGKLEDGRAFVRVDGEPEIAVIESAALQWFF